MTKEDRLLVWLRDAHAMEKQAETMLTAQASRIESYPDLKGKIEEHLAETRRQSDMLQSCIERRGGDTSTLKDLMGKFAAMGQGLGGAVMDDEIRVRWPAIPSSTWKLQPIRSLSPRRKHAGIRRPPRSASEF